MDLDGISPALAIRSSVGIEIWNSPSFKSPYEPNEKFSRDESKNCRSMVFSPNGKYFAYTNGATLKIINTSDWTEKCTLPRPKAFHLKFSPHENYLVTWELFTTTKDNPEGSPNMFVYKIETNEEVFSRIQKKQTDWEPCWSNDESLFALMIGGEAFFYELSGSEGGFQSSARKLGGGRNGSLSIGPSNSPPYLAFYVPGVKGSPSMCKIYKYPAIQQNQAVTCKSFFQADRVEMLWNKRGSGLLLLISTDVDQTGASYYGKQALHFMSTKSDSYAVQLSKDGPIHSVSWSPKANEFVVVYGFMPAKATLFNLKCDPIFDFGEGSRNCSYFNNFGNLLVFGGFGNLRGYVEVWDMNKKNKISTLQAPDSTLLQWSPTGEVFLTATTSPRLRIGNGFKVWHYSGALLHETSWPEGQELLEVQWQKYAEGTFIEKPISNEKIEGIKSNQPEASKQVYQPPNVRLMKEGKLPIEDMPAPNIPPGYPKSSSNSNRQRKQRKPRDKNNIDNSNKVNTTTGTATVTNNVRNTKDSQKNSTNTTNKAENVNEKDNKPVTGTNQHQQQDQQQRQHYYRQKSGDQPQSQRPRYPRSSYRHTNQQVNTGDPEKDKKIRNISRKLQDISKLKSKLNKGEHLEANQLTKIANEATLIEELRTLKVTT